MFSKQQIRDIFEQWTQGKPDFKLVALDPESLEVVFSYKGTNVTTSIGYMVGSIGMRRKLDEIVRAAKSEVA